MKVELRKIAITAQQFIQPAPRNAPQTIFRQIQDNQGVHAAQIGKKFGQGVICDVVGL
jgi:hypothetical protein